MARTGDFREDLYYRLNVVAIDAAAAARPPRGHRRCWWTTSCDASPTKATARSVSREAIDLLLKHHYPGNVRELENLVHRAVVLARGDVITTADLPLHLAGLEPGGQGRVGRASSSGSRPSSGRSSVEALEKADGVQTRAAAPRSA